MLRIILTFIGFLFLKINSFSQANTFFNLLPDIGAVEKQCVFSSVACDSNYIYVIGDMVVSQDSIGRNKKVRVHLTKLDYKGNVLLSKTMSDSNFTPPYARSGPPLYRQNDSTYYYNMYNQDNVKNIYLSNYIVKFDFRSAKVVNNVKVIKPTLKDESLVCYSVQEQQSDSLFFVFRHEYFDSIRKSDNYIYIYDKELKLKTKTLINTTNRIITIRHIDFKEYYYNLIGTELDFKNNEFTGKGWMVYLKVDTSGKVIKEQKLLTNDNNYISSGFTYAVLKDSFIGYYMATNKLMNINNKSKYIPYIIHVSSEFDSIYWNTRFQHPLLKDGTNEIFINNMINLIDNSGLVVCGSLNTSPFAEPDYGLLMKCSLNGDSLWTRQIQPLAWDSTRAAALRFESISNTPYNTIVVCGMVVDYTDALHKAWLVHLDSDGCLIPGCGKVSKVEDIYLGIEKAFKIYPNPSTNGMIYILSQFSSNEDYHIELSDITGKIIKNTKFQPTQGVQYLLNIDNSVPQGEYILRMMGKEFQQTEKIIIEK